MLKTELQTCSQTIASPVNVLFAECPAELVGSLKKRLIEKKLSWDTTPLAELER